MQHVYLWNYGDGGQLQTVEQMFSYSIRFQVLCKTQDELDILRGYALMFSRGLEVDTWDEWNRKRGMRQLQSHHDHSIMPLRLLPIVFTTWPNAELRGL